MGEPNVNNYYVYIYFDPTKPNFLKLGLVFDFEPIYIGCGTKNRWRDHLSQAKNKEFLKTGNKYKFFKIKQILSLGKEPIIIKYKENLSREEAFLIEKELIDKIGMAINNNGPLTNLVEGGRINPVLPGEKNPMYKKTWSEERRKKHSENIKRINKSLTKEEYDKKYRNRVISEETRKKLSEASKGINNPNYGKHKPKKEKIILPSKQIKHWIVTKPDGEKIEVFSLHKFCLENNLEETAMKKAGRLNRVVMSGKCTGWAAVQKKIDNQ